MYEWEEETVNEEVGFLAQGFSGCMDVSRTERYRVRAVLPCSVCHAAAKTRTNRWNEDYHRNQLAIQAKSTVKAEAWKFIAYLLSEEGQSLQERQGFSLLKSVNEKQLNDIQKQVKSGKYKLPDGKAPKVSDEEFTQFKQLISTADNFAVVDGSVISIIGDDSRAFFSGQKSAEEVAKLIQNKATTFLNE
jgi:ABC-type glycerol-3-phosphate transport system substrate-binding protein